MGLMTNLCRVLFVSMLRCLASLGRRGQGFGFRSVWDATALGQLHYYTIKLGFYSTMITAIAPVRDNYEVEPLIDA